MAQLTKFTQSTFTREDKSSLWFTAEVSIYNTFVVNPRTDPASDQMEKINFLQQNGWNYESPKYVTIYYPCAEEEQRFMISLPKDRTVEQVSNSDLTQIQLPFNLVFQDDDNKRWVVIKSGSTVSTVSTATDDLHRQTDDPLIPDEILSVLNSTDIEVKVNQPKITIPFKLTKEDFILNDAHSFFNAKSLSFDQDLYVTIRNYQNSVLLIPGTKLIGANGKVKILKEKTRMVIC